MRTLIALHLIAGLLIFSVFVACGSDAPAPTSDNNNSPAKTGSMQIRVNGVAPPHQPKISVAGPDSYSRAVTGDILLSDLKTGNYTVNSQPIVDSLGDTVYTTTPVQQIVVQENKTVTVNVDYVQGQGTQYGSLLINVTGLPDGINADVRVFDPGDNLIQTITATTQLNSISSGSYKIIGDPVFDGNDSLFADPDSVMVSVSAGQTTDVTITYSLKFVMKVFAEIDAGKLVASMGGSADNTSDNQDVNDLDQGTVQRYTNIGCELTVADVTGTGFNRSISGSAMGASASITQTLSVVPNSEVSLSTSTDVSVAVPPATTYGFTSVLAETRSFPFILQFSNPERDTVEVHFTWSVSGSASGGGSDPSRAGASVQSWLHLPVTQCYTSLWQTSSVTSFSAYWDHLGNDYPASSTDTTIVFNSSFFMIGVDFQSKCMGNGFFEIDVGSGGGTGSITSNLTATVTRH